MAPHDVATVQTLVRELGLPFPVLADENRAIFQAYEVHSRAWSLGQRPALFVIDRDGLIRYAHVGTQQWDIPATREVIRRLDELAQGASPERNEAS